MKKRTRTTNKTRATGKTTTMQGQTEVLHPETTVEYHLRLSFVGPLPEGLPCLAWLEEGTTYIDGTGTHHVIPEGYSGHVVATRSWNRYGRREHTVWVRFIAKIGETVPIETPNDKKEGVQTW